jgi:hypothetical protein
MPLPTAGSWTIEDTEKIRKFVRDLFRVKHYCLSIVLMRAAVLNTQFVRCDYKINRERKQ